MRHAVFAIVISAFGLVTTTYASMGTSLDDGQGILTSPSGEQIIVSGRGANSP